MEYLNKQWLHNQYVTREKTTRAIGKICSVDHVTILKWLKKHNIPTRQTWTKNPVYLGPQGYMMISMGSKKKGGAYLHRYIIEQKLGRTLDSQEIVHHKDGNKLNNNINNLELMTHKIHNNIHKNGTGGPGRKWPHPNTCTCIVCKKSSKNKPHT